MRVGIVGAGYVGLTTGASLAELGHDVVCVDADNGKIAKLVAGEMPFYEPGLKDSVTRNVELGRLRFSYQVDLAYQAQVVFCAVGTPPLQDGSADLRAVYAVADAFARSTSDGMLVVKSTVPPGTVTHLIARIGRTVVDNPEFLREGSAVHDALNPDRIVIGTLEESARAVMRDLYASLIARGVPVVETDPTSAETIKYASNAFLATKISFINEVANFCEASGADVTAVARGMGFDHRIGSEFLRPGVGYGGSCFPKDIQALIAAGTRAGYDFRLLPVVETVNQEQRKRLYEKLLKEIGGSVAGKRVALWGLAFKPDTDDVREAPALYFLRRLIDEGAEVVAYDPAAMDNARQLFPSALYTSSALEAVVDADALILLTEWPEFLSISFETIIQRMRGEVLLRGR